MITTCRCGAYKLLTATGLRYEDNAGAICRHTPSACTWFAPSHAPSRPETESAEPVSEEHVHRCRCGRPTWFDGYHRRCLQVGCDRQREYCKCDPVDPRPDPPAVLSVETDWCHCHKAVPGMWTSGYSAERKSFVRHAAAECVEYVPFVAAPPAETGPRFRLEGKGLIDTQGGFDRCTGCGQLPPHAGCKAICAACAPPTGACYCAGCTVAGKSAAPPADTGEAATLCDCANPYPPPHVCYDVTPAPAPSSEEACPDCGGSGYDSHTETWCETCGGTGKRGNK